MNHFRIFSNNAKLPSIPEFLSCMYNLEFNLSFNPCFASLQKLLIMGIGTLGVTTKFSTVIEVGYPRKHMRRGLCCAKTRVVGPCRSNQVSICMPVLRPYCFKKCGSFTFTSGPLLAIEIIFLVHIWQRGRGARCAHHFIFAFPSIPTFQTIHHTWCYGTHV